MAKPTVQNCLDLARTFLGDDDVSGGQDFVNATLIPHLQAAYRDMVRILVNLQIPKIQAEAFYPLPAYQTTLDPAQAGITDISDILGVEERGSVTTLNVVTATAGTNQWVVQVNNHGLSAGAIIQTNGIQGPTPDINGTWGIAIQDANNIILLGATATGAYTSGGTVSYSAEQFVPLEEVDRIDIITATPSQRITAYAIEGYFLRFLPASTIRQLRIIYDISGSLSSGTSTVVPVEDSIDYLALQTAFRVARARDLQIAQELQLDADWVIKNMGNIGVRSLQGLSRRRPPFRPRRNQFALY